MQQSQLKMKEDSSIVKFLKVAEPLSLIIGTLLLLIVLLSCLSQFAAFIWREVGTTVFASLLIVPVFLIIAFEYYASRKLRLPNSGNKIQTDGLIRVKSTPSQRLAQLFIALLIFFSANFLYQLLIAYIDLQKALVSFSQIDSRINYKAPNASLLEGVPDALTISFLTFIVLAVGTFFTQFFSLRTDLRNKKAAELNKAETDLRIAKLELEIAELKSKKKLLPKVAALSRTTRLPKKSSTAQNKSSTV